MLAETRQFNYHDPRGRMSLARSSEFSGVAPLLVLAVTVLTLFFARDLLIPFTFALTLAFLLAPAVSRLEARRVPRIVAVAITGVLAFTMIGGVGYVVARQLLNVARDLPAYRLGIQKKIASVHSPAEQSIEKAFTAVEDISGDLAASASKATPYFQGPFAQVQPVRVVDPDRTQLQSIIELLVRFLRPIGTFGVVIVFTVYLLMKREDLRRRILVLAGMSRIRLINQALQEAATRISQYLFFQVAVNAAFGSLFGLGLFFIGIPDATLWGALAGILRIIPYVGAATGLVLPLVVSVAAFPSWGPPMLIIGLFVALELTATNFVEPWLFSSRTGISSLALLAMAIFWALLWGWPGLILSTPLTVCIVVLGRYVPQMSFLHTLLGTDAELSADAFFYDRLLAMDQHEARAVAHRFLAGNTLGELYDSVLIPALALVEQERHQGVLDDARCNFFFLSIGELVAEFASYRQEETGDPALGAPEFSMQEDFAVVCISASDQADELSTQMLVQLMELDRNQALYLPASVSSEILDALAKEPNTVIFISAVPPFAFAQARTICERVRSHLPDNRIVIGLWNPTENLDQLHDLTVERFGNGRPAVVVNTLAKAIRQVTLWHQDSVAPAKSGRRDAGMD
jgi:predicted PurR-regulated permease PerM